MMCPHMEVTLNEYVDGTLSARDRASVEAHLAECATCRTAVEWAGWAAVQADFDRATDELSRVLAAERERLRPETVVLLERNLALIDAAIAESRAALARDPANGELRRLFTAASRQKVELLRWAA